METDLDVDLDWDLLDFMKNQGLDLGKQNIQKGGVCAFIYFVKIISMNWKRRKSKLTKICASKSFSQT